MEVEKLRFTWEEDTEEPEVGQGRQPVPVWQRSAIACVVSMNRSMSTGKRVSLQVFTCMCGGAFILC